MDADSIAEALWAEARDSEQASRRVVSDDVAAAVRERVRDLAREAGVRIRTARTGDAVVAVRLDAAVWNEDAATMRAKLLPEG